MFVKQMNPFYAIMLEDKTNPDLTVKVNLGYKLSIAVPMRFLINNSIVLGRDRCPAGTSWRGRGNFFSSSFFGITGADLELKYQAGNIHRGNDRVYEFEHYIDDEVLL